MHFQRVSGVIKNNPSRPESKKRQRDSGEAPVEGEPKKKKVDKRKLKIEEARANSMKPPPLPESFPAWSEREFFKYELVHQSKKPGSRARVGKITTPHGVIHTPAFVPVGTNGALKAVSSRGADETGVQLMFCNTYHLLVHPGPDVIEKGGGLHKYMNRTGPIITDSGGFQVASKPINNRDLTPQSIKLQVHRPILYSNSNLISHVNSNLIPLGSSSSGLFPGHDVF